MSASAEEREGPLTRVTNFVYRLIVIEVAFVLATLPALLGILLLDQEPSNIPLYGLFALFFGRRSLRGSMPGEGIMTSSPG